MPKEPEAEMEAKLLPEALKGVYRQEALAHFFKEEGPGAVIRIATWAWGIVVVASLGVATALVLAFFGRIEVTGKGVGAIRPKAHVRSLTCAIQGRVARICVSPGAMVKKGDLILEIDATQLRSDLYENQSRIELLEQKFKPIATSQDALGLEQQKRIINRISMLESQVKSLEESVEVSRQKLAANLVLEESGLVSHISVQDIKESLAQAKRNLTSGKESLEQAKQELAALESRRKDESWHRGDELETNYLKRGTLAFSIEQTRVVASVDGQMDSLAVKVGDLVSSGQTVGKMVPTGTPLEAVAFPAEKDRAFLHPGDQVQLELEQFPYTEFGMVKGTITRISENLAAQSDVHEVLGEDTKLESPAYQIEIDLAEVPQDIQVRPGMLLKARYTLRRQRAITILLDPLKRWLK